MRRQLPTSNISTSRNDVLFHVTGVLPAIEILKTGAIKCSKPSAWERANGPKLSWPSVCKASQVQSISDACETLSEIWRVRNQLLRLRASGQELPDNPNYSRVAAAMRW